MPTRANIPAYGNSFGEITGGTIMDISLSGDINQDQLMTTAMSDELEFNTFYGLARDFILASLGHPVTKVELTDYQFKIAIDQAVAKMNFHAPGDNRQFATFVAQAGKGIYEVPSYILDTLTYVGYSKSLLSIQQAAGTLEQDFFIKYFQENFLFTDFSVGEFNLLQVHLETMRKVLGNEGSFDIIGNKYIQLYPTPRVGNQRVILEYKAINAETINPEYKIWIFQYALALAKGMLGQSRGKYKVLPGPQGGAQLNGDELIRQSMEEQQRLEDKLRDEFEEPPAFTMF